PGHLVLLNQSRVAFAPLRRSEVRPPYTARDEVLMFVPDDAEKGFVGLQNPAVEIPHEDADDIGVDQTPNFCIALLAFIDVDRQAVPLDDASLSITQWLSTDMVPTIFAVRPTYTLQVLVGVSRLNRVEAGLCSCWKIVRMQEFLPAEIEEILETTGAGKVQGSLIDTGYFAIRPRYPEHAGHRCFDDLTELVFALPQCFLGSTEFEPEPRNL